MMKKTDWIIIIVAIAVILFAISGIYAIYFSETEKVSIELDVFRNMARNSTCTDITNDLFIIDNQMVFWATEGNCADASYAYTLFGSHPNEILCRKYDSIAGPQEQCYNIDFQEIFQIIINNLNANNLGLSRNYNVTEILF
jgi:hypothetical protein